jgi:hypothetical protein
MAEKDTQELEKILSETHPGQFDAFCKNNSESINGDSFSEYMKKCFKAADMSQQEIFLKADIPERYGYKLLSEEKHTKQRDVILRICYAAQMTLEQTQRALKKYNMPTLYAKIPRDALLMVLFNERPGSIIEVNAALKRHGMEPLRTSGLQN